MDIFYINSNNIKVFPTSNRDDRYDRNARLNTEQNIVSLVNRLTGNQNFVIDGLDVYKNGNEYYLSAGSCSIGGYYFKILTDVSIGTSASNKDKLVASIQLDTFNIAEGTSYTEDIYYLLGNDLDSNNNYTGLNISITNDSITNDLTNNNILYLILAEYIDNKWQNYNDSRIINDSPMIIDDGELSDV